MALGTYFTKAKKKVEKVADKAASYIMKPVDNWIEKNKQMDAARRERDRKMIVENFGSEENYLKRQREAAEALEKKRIEERDKKQKKKSSYFLGN